MSKDDQEPITQTSINWHELWKAEQAQVLKLSAALEQAQKTQERCEAELASQSRWTKELEKRVVQLQEFVADEMTNLSSMGMLSRQLELYMEQYKRMLHGLGEPATLPENRLVVLSIDLDRFSGVVDKYGRPFGDSILRFVGQSITARIRKCDIASRRGQRFTVVLMDCTRLGAIMKARKIAQSIAAENFGTGTGERIFVTVTTGVADYDGKISGEELLRRAERAMKYGKDHGRYCTVMCKEDGGHEVVESFVRNGNSRTPSLM